MGIIFMEQRDPSVISVAADVHVVHSHMPDQIQAWTCTDEFDKLHVPINYVTVCYLVLVTSYLVLQFVFQNPHTGKRIRRR